MKKLMAGVAAVTIMASAGMAMAADTTATTRTTVKSTTITPVEAGTAINAQVQTAADQSPVMLTGVIKSVGKDEFVMSYGSGDITVEMDGWRWDDDHTKYLRAGDRVTVTGQIDDDLFEGREVEATNIYVLADNMYYYRDESARYPTGSYGHAGAMADGTFVTMAGTVSSINGHELTLTGSDNMAMKVDLKGLDYDPLDAEGVQRIRVGDIIQVYGEIDEGFFESKEIVASRVVSVMNR